MSATIKCMVHGCQHNSKGLCRSRFISITVNGDCSNMMLDMTHTIKKGFLNRPVQRAR